MDDGSDDTLTSVRRLAAALSALGVPDPAGDMTGRARAGADPAGDMGGHARADDVAGHARDGDMGGRARLSGDPAGRARAAAEWGDAEARRMKAIAELGGIEAYRAWLASALLGAAQSEAMVADRLPLSRDSRYAVWQRQLDAAGVDNPARRAEIIQWQVRRACAPLPGIAQESRTDPIPLATAQAAEALQTLLAVSAATRGAVEAGDVRRLAAQAARLREARKALQAAVDNTDVLLELLGSVDL